MSHASCIVMWTQASSQQVLCTQNRGRSQNSRTQLTISIAKKEDKRCPDGCTRANMLVHGNSNKCAKPTGSFEGESGMRTKHDIATCI